MTTRRRARVVEVTEEELHQRMTQDVREQRGGVRVATDLQLDMPLPSWDQVRRVYTRNISHGGLMFRVESPVTLPGSAKVVLQLPDTRTITLDAEIRHAARVDGTNEVEVGVQFKALPDHVDEALRAALNAVSPTR